MNEIRFSIYSEQLAPLANPDFIMRKFEDRFKTSVHIEHMSWEEAWPKLLNFALHGGGPHVSIIGAIWTQSLAFMNTLRPFTHQEINHHGGADAFFSSTWKNAVFNSPDEAWAIPFNVYTYLVLYRRDLLEKSGVDEKSAFISPEAMLVTLEKLKGAGIASPIVLPSGKPFLSRIHILSSWVWGTGGDFVSSDGRRVLLTQDETLNGFSSFINLYRYLDPGDYGLTQSECQQRFADGKAAIVIAGSTSQETLRVTQVQPVLENLGVAPVPGYPWIAGANLVIWREAQFLYQDDQLALALTKFLSSTSTQIKCAEAGVAVPARIEAFESISFTPPIYKPAISQSLQTGRTYTPVPSWIRMLNMLRPCLDDIIMEYLETPSENPRMLIAKHLDPVAKRFGILLAGLR